MYNNALGKGIRLNTWNNDYNGYTCVQTVGIWFSTNPSFTVVNIIIYSRQIGCAYTYISVFVNSTEYFLFVKPLFWRLHTLPISVKTLAGSLSAKPLCKPSVPSKHNVSWELAFVWCLSFYSCRANKAECLPKAAYEILCCAFEHLNFEAFALKRDKISDQKVIHYC